MIYNILHYKLTWILVLLCVVHLKVNDGISSNGLKDATVGPTKEHTRSSIILKLSYKGTVYTGLYGPDVYSFK